MNNVVGGPARGTDFFDREREQAAILERVRDGNHLLVLAPRQMGKTSLLYRLLVVGRDAGLTPAYASVGDSRDENDFLGKLVVACLRTRELAAAEAFRRLNRGPFEGLFGLFREVVDTLTLEKFTLKLREMHPDQSDSLAREVARALRSLPGTWMLMLDEVSVFVMHLWRLDPTGQRARNFLTWFRELRQGGPDGYPVRWVLAGSIGLDTVARRLRAAATINDLMPFLLGPFSPPVADRLLQELGARYELDLSPPVRQRCLERLGWLNPYAVQALFAALRARCEDERVVPTADTVDAAFEDLLGHAYRSYFDHWYQRLTEELGAPDDGYARRLLTVAARDSQGVTRSTLDQDLATLVSDPDRRAELLSWLLDVLVTDSYLVEVGAGPSRWQFQSPMLREYWRRTMGEWSGPLPVALEPNAPVGRADIEHGTLTELCLTNVGPAAEFHLELGSRLNVVTGDNGLGKTFLLDAVWWALTSWWPREVNPRSTSGYPAQPDGGSDATIQYTLTGTSAQQVMRSQYVRAAQSWTPTRSEGVRTGVVLYAQADGAFSVWDPVRNRRRDAPPGDGPERPAAFVFTPPEVWDGLAGNGESLCNGLVRDWAGWQKARQRPFRLLRAVLEHLSPDADEQLRPGPLTRMGLGDVRDIPTIQTPYSAPVAILRAAAGIRRVSALAYLLVWAWEEHQRAAHLVGVPPVRSLVLLLDEVETHLHPRWQRTLLGALLRIADLLGKGVGVQLVVTTHSPLVLASLEPHFDAERDAWFDLDLEGAPGKKRRPVVLAKRPWVRYGDVSCWLTSEAFDLKDAGSLEREQVLEEAARALSDEHFGREQARELQARLRAVLGDIDPFWLRWKFVGERRGWLP